MSSIAITGAASQAHRNRHHCDFKNFPAQTNCAALPETRRLYAEMDMRKRDYTMAEHHHAEVVA